VQETCGVKCGESADPGGFNIHPKERFFVYLRHQQNSPSIQVPYVVLVSHQKSSSIKAFNLSYQHRAA